MASLMFLNARKRQKVKRTSELMKMNFSQFHSYNYLEEQLLGITCPARPLKIYFFPIA